MHPAQLIFFSLLRSTLTGQPLADFKKLTPGQWHDIFRISADQGLLGLIGMAIQTLPPDLCPPKALHIQWVLAMKKRTAHYEQMLLRSAEFAALLQAQDIPCVVLKGLAISTLYPDPSQREFGDLDCYLLGQYSKGNTIARAAGASVEEDDYKHSHIYYKSIPIENHQYITNFACVTRGKQLELLLQELLHNSPTIGSIENTALRIPCDDFTALFLMIHAQRHFMSEGIRMRFIVDWAVFLSKRQAFVHWGRLSPIMDQYGMTTFVSALTDICVQYMGTQLTTPGIPCHTEARYVELLIADTFGDQPTVFGNTLWQKAKRIIRRFRRIQRYRPLMNLGLRAAIWEAFAYSSYLHRKPTIHR